MSRLTTVALGILQGLRLVDDPLTRTNRQVKDAVHVLSKRTSEAEYHRLMTNFYTERAKSTDPHTHWWDFADAKQKELDHSNDWAVERKRAQEAQARLDARMTQYRTIREKEKQQ